MNDKGQSEPATASTVKPGKIFSRQFYAPFGPRVALIAYLPFALTCLYAQSTGRETMTTMKAYSEMTTAERRSAGAKQAAKTRAEDRLARTYGERFGYVFGVQERWFYKAMEAALRSGVDAPRLIKRRREVEEIGREFDRKQAEFQATPITADTEREYTALIKTRRLYDGACMLAWEMYFKFRDQHSDCEPLTPDDLAYAGMWTACAT
jgi:hypothetical protein